MSNTVKVAVFRNETDRLSRRVNCDYHACVGVGEVKNWKRITCRVLAEVEVITCKRATAYDLERFDRAIADAKIRIIQADERIAALEVKDQRVPARAAVKLPLPLPLWIRRRPANDALV